MIEILHPFASAILESLTVRILLSNVATMSLGSPVRGKVNGGPYIA